VNYHQSASQIDTLPSRSLTDVLLTIGLKYYCSFELDLFSALTLCLNFGCLKGLLMIVTKACEILFDKKT
jgi:hypothetical protein